MPRFQKSSIVVETTYHIIPGGMKRKSEEVQKVMAEDQKLKEKAEVKSKEKAESKFNKKWIEGLTFTGSKAKVEEKDGRKVKKFTPFDRPMTEADVLAWKDYGKYVVIVSADGQKVQVEK